MTAAGMFVVGTADFRAALTAVRPHAYAGKDPIPSLERVRVAATDSVNATVLACDGRVAAAALVSLDDLPTGEPATVDLSPRDVAEILAVFPAPGKEDPGAQLRVEVYPGSVQVVDCGGLWEGKRLTLPALPVSDGFPDVPRLLARTLRDAEDGAVATDELGLVVDGKRVAAFRAAAAAYGEPLLLRTCGPARTRLLVLCGESFLGVVLPGVIDDAEAGRYADWQRAWRRRLPAPPAPGSADDAPLLPAPEPAPADQPPADPHAGDPGDAGGAGDGVVDLGSRRGRRQGR